MRVNSRPHCRNRPAAQPRLRPRGSPSAKTRSFSTPAPSEVKPRTHKDPLAGSSPGRKHPTFHPETAVGKPRNTRNTRRDRTKGCRGGSADVHLPGERRPERSGQFLVSFRGFRGLNRFFQVHGRSWRCLQGRELSGEPFGIEGTPPLQPEFRSGQRQASRLTWRAAALPPGNAPERLVPPRGVLTAGIRKFFLPGRAVRLHGRQGGRSRPAAATPAWACRCSSSCICSSSIRRSRRQRR